MHGAAFCACRAYRFHTDIEDLTNVPLGYMIPGTPLPRISSYEMIQSNVCPYSCAAVVEPLYKFSSLKYRCCNQTRQQKKYCREQIFNAEIIIFRVKVLYISME